jgi:hypothetical protein
MESSTMRSNLGLSVVLTSAILACVGETNLFAQQPSAVSTSVPNIQAPGAAAVTNPSNVIQQSTGVVPAGTSASANYSGNSVVQPGATTTIPSNGMTNYYYYPARNGGMSGTAAPGTYYYYTTGSNPVYTVPAQAYYTPVRRGFPFGLFRRRYVQPMTPTYYTTTATTTTPTYYYTSPGYYYTPTTYYTVPAATTAPAGTSTSSLAPGTTAPAYTPTTYNVPNENLPAGTTPSATVPSGVTTPSRTIPAPPSIDPK